MLSLSGFSPHFIVSSYSFADSKLLVFPSVFRRNQRLFVSLNFVGVQESGFSLLRLRHSKRARNYDMGILYCGFSDFMRRCKGLESGGDFDLETEVLEFMKNSKKPDAFPSKKELIDAGRMDLVDAIVKKGGWLSLGWHIEEEGSQEREFGSKGTTTAIGSDNFQENNSLAGEESHDAGVFSSFSKDYSYSASSLGKSLETSTLEEDTGIEGILSRLEKERNYSFSLGEKGENSHFPSYSSKDDCSTNLSKDMTVASLVRNRRGAAIDPENAVFYDSRSTIGREEPFFDISNSLKPEMWRAWRTQSADFSDLDFKDETETGGAINFSKNEMQEIGDVASEPNERNELNLHPGEITYNQIQSRLQHLELELSSVLHSLRWNAEESSPKKVHQSSYDDSHILFDAWEFLENDIMNAQDKLRSLRAKKVVLESKMAMALIDAQKNLEVKQNRIDNARRALRFIRSTCIVWPNSASQVLLVGSFDGWATQRKMEQSSTGVFSLHLQLYPGKYEIKFIVDGEWRVDPLRPIVCNNGFENNILMVT